MLHNETLVFVTTMIVASGKRFYCTFPETCLATSLTEFHEISHVTRCNACANLYCSAVAQKVFIFSKKFQGVTAALKVSSNEQIHYHVDDENSYLKY